MKRLIRKQIIKAIKTVGSMHIDDRKRAVKAVNQGDFEIEGNDVIVGKKTFLTPFLYWNIV